jgi:hypothetical protein
MKLQEVGTTASESTRCLERMNFLNDGLAKNHFELNYTHKSFAHEL